MRSLVAGVLVLAGVGACAPNSAPPAPSDARQCVLLGQALELPARPQRVLAGNVGTLELLLGLVDEQRLAAVPPEGYRYSVLGATPERLEGVPQFATFDAESILASSPDLVLASDWQALETVVAVSSAGVPVLRIPTPFNWAAVEEILSALGEALGEEQRAEELLRELALRRTALRDRAAKLPRRSALVYSNYGAGGSTAGAGTTWDVVLELAGVPNAAQEADIAGNQNIDLERLLELAPDVLLLSDGVGGQAALAELRSLPAGSLNALEQGHVVHLPVALFSCSSQHMLDLAELVVERLEQL